MNKVKKLLTNLKSYTSLSLRPFLRKAFTKRNFPTILFIVIGIVVISGVVFGTYKLVVKANSSNTSKIEIAGAKATTSINKEYNFPLKDGKGKEVSKIKYIIESADLRDEILVKGQKARSVKGRTFFILNLKIVNDFDQKIEIQTGDYIRLSVNGNKNVWIAPDVHSDPVSVQAISSKFVRIGFAINDSDKDLVLKIGEINGEKQELEIKF